MRNKADRDSKTGRFLPGHLIASKHGVTRYLATGKLPSIRGKKAIQKHLEEIRSGIEEMTPRMNAKKRILISQIVRTEGVLQAIELYIQRAGIIDEKKFISKKMIMLQPCFNSYLSFLNSQRLAIMALGLEGQAEKIITLDEIVAEHDQKEKTKGGKSGK